MGLNERQRRGVCLILSGHTQRRVAELVGVSEQTVSRWVTRNIEFARELARLRGDRRASALAMVDAAVPRVLQVAVQVALDERTPGPTRLRAARLVLEVAGVLGQPSVVVEVTDAPRLVQASDEELRRELRSVLDGAAPKILEAS